MHRLNWFIGHYCLMNLSFRYDGSAASFLHCSMQNIGWLLRLEIISVNSLIECHVIRWMLAPKFTYRKDLLAAKLLKRQIRNLHYNLWLYSKGKLLLGLCISWVVTKLMKITEDYERQPPHPRPPAEALHMIDIHKLRIVFYSWKLHIYPYLPGLSSFVFCDLVYFSHAWLKNCINPRKC